MLNTEKIKEDLKNNLSKYRYEHSIRVAEEASTLSYINKSALGVYLRKI